MLQSPHGVPERGRDGDSTAKAVLTSASPFLGTRTEHFMPSCCLSILLQGQEKPSKRTVLPSSPVHPIAPKNLFF